jgi:membrane-associated protease RseP (regulator of RpoE activity)
MQDGLVKVVWPIEGAPAARAGLLPNDLISGIDDAPVRGLTQNQAVAKMRGAAGTTIKLTIIRAGEDKPLEFSITRDLVEESPGANQNDTVANPRASGEQTGPDRSKEPTFTVAMANKVYYGPVNFLGQSEPHMTLALAGAGPEFGVSVAELNLKLISDLVSTLKVGGRGVAYIVDSAGRVIAHPDSSLVQRDLSNLAHVQAARAAGATASTEAMPFAKDIHGGDVLAAHAVVPMLDWLVILELPTDEITAPTP